MDNSDFIIKTEKELIERLEKLKKEEVRVTFGVRPSGELHVGHLVTFVNSLHTIKKVCSRLGLRIKCYIKIVDLDSLKDFNYCLQPISYWGEVFKYAEPNLKLYVKEIKEVFNNISKAIDLQFNIFLESELYKTELFIKQLFAWVDSKKIGVFPEKIQLYGICSECSHFSGLYCREKGFLFRCLNDNCNKFYCAEKPFNINCNEICFNLIDRPMIKDEFWNIDIHIIGGDHLIKRQGNSRMNILANRSIRFFEKVPYHYSTGRILLGSDNDKMSKSRGNTISAKKFINENYDWYSKLVSTQEYFKF